MELINEGLLLVWIILIIVWMIIQYAINSDLYKRLKALESRKRK
jgi:hypothetical protein